MLIYPVGGGHIGFLIGIKNLNFVEGLPVINGSLIHNVFFVDKLNIMN